MSAIDDWLESTIDRDEKESHSKQKAHEDSPPTSNVSKIIKSSQNFPIQFPINTVCCETLRRIVKEDILDRNINSAYPLIHEATLILYQKFLKHKLQFGSEIEKKFYTNMDVVDLVDRFLKRRAIYFVGENDKWMLIDKSRGFGNWESIGTSNESGNLTLENCLSYDEIKLSALMSISSYTYFVNDGNRMNDGIPVENRENIEEEGVIVGLIGPRFEKEYVMEYQDVMIDPKQNVESRGYGKNTHSTSAALFSKFYQKPNWTYKEFLRDKKDEFNFIDLGNEIYFDNLTYSKRLTLSFDTFLLEANDRARKSGKFAYVHVVGIGLGVWAYSKHQTEAFMNTFAERLGSLGQYLHSVSDVVFSYIRSLSCGKYKDEEKMPIQGHPSGGIKIHITRREPHLRLTGEHAGKLLVVSYAWDGNAFPGNEFWWGSLHGSGDPAAASSTQIGEIHNVYINEVVCGRNLRVVTRDGLKRIDVIDK